MDERTDIRMTVIDRFAAPALTVALTVALLGALGCRRATPAGDASAQPAPSIEAARQAYFQFDLARTTEVYEAIWADETPVPETSAKDRAAAGRELARIAALFDQDLARACELLGQAGAIEGEAVPALLLLARVERESGNYEAARAAADAAAARSETPSELLDAHTEFAHAVQAEAVDAVLAETSSLPARDLLEDALERIVTVLEDRRGALEASLVQLELALLLGDGPRALDAWNSYFHVPPGEMPTGVLGEPARALARLLPGWQAPDGAAHLAIALANSRMFEPAALVARRSTTNVEDLDPRLREIVAYHDYLVSARETTVSYYRVATAARMAETAGPDHEALKEDLEQAARRLWPYLGRSSVEPPPFSRSRFETEIAERFGAEISFQKANGHFGLHMGHRVVDENYPIEQYGKKAELRFVSLDFMVSNGYSSWFWDGRAQVGGWAENPIITQVREAYAGSGIHSWEQLTDPKKREEIERKIAESEARDIELARDNPYAYLPSLARRIELAALEKALRELQAKGLESADLRLAFIAEVERIEFESSIIAHEGRHAIEARSPLNFTRRGATKEFLAKLSEVAFSSAPFLALGGGILSPNIGDGTSHGEANERIVKGLVEWMDENRSAIRDLDRDLPLLPQLDRLTDEQLRQAFRSMDPRAG